MSHDLMTNAGLDIETSNVSEELYRVAGLAEERATTAFLKQVSNVDWKGLSSGERSGVLAKAIAAYKNELKGINWGSLSDMANATLTRAIEASSKAYGLKGQGKNEERTNAALEAAVKRFEWFGRKNQEKIALKLEELVKTLVVSGEGEVEQKALEQRTLKVANTESYWRGSASAFVARARSWGSLITFETTKVYRFRLVATIDEFTSELCDMMHGYEFDLPEAIAQFEKVDRSPPEKIKELCPWAYTASNGDGEKAIFYKVGDEKRVIARVRAPGNFERKMDRTALKLAGFLVPPFHDYCRTKMKPI